MSYIILDKSVVIDGNDLGNFILVNEINTNAITGESIANINISNTEIYFTVPLDNNDIEKSIENFFLVISENIEAKND